MNYTIMPASLDDQPVIYRLFEEAITFQKANNYIGWSSYDKVFIKADIEKRQLFKIVLEDEIVCIYSIYKSDVLIWREKEIGDSIYIHRIVLNRKFSGRKLFANIVNWAIEFAKRNKLKYIRMDTWAENKKIIAYYESYGFSLIEFYRTPATENLPVQHRNLLVALLEKKVI